MKNKEIAEFIVFAINDCDNDYDSREVVEFILDHANDLDGDVRNPSHPLNVINYHMYEKHI
jgi:hypothetical protein